MTPKITAKNWRKEFDKRFCCYSTNCPEPHIFGDPKKVKSFFSKVLQAQAKDLAGNINNVLEKNLVNQLPAFPNKKTKEQLKFWLHILKIAVDKTSQEVLERGKLWVK